MSRACAAHWLLCSKWDHHFSSSWTGGKWVRWARGQTDVSLQWRGERGDKEEIGKRGTCTEDWSTVNYALQQFFFPPDIPAPSDWIGQGSLQCWQMHSVFWKKIWAAGSLKTSRDRRKKKRKKANLKYLDFNRGLNVIFTRNKCHAVTTSESNLPCLT